MVGFFWLVAGFVFFVEVGFEVADAAFEVGNVALERFDESAQRHLGGVHRLRSPSRRAKRSAAQSLHHPKGRTSRLPQCGHHRSGSSITATVPESMSIKSKRRVDTYSTYRSDRQTSMISAQ